MKNKNIIDSFSNAFNGIIATFKAERNMKIHVTAAIFVLVLSLFLDITAVEFLIVSITIAFVIMAELMNTAIEAVVDLACGKRIEPLAKIAKDAASGAVLVSALNSLAVGYLIFFQKLSQMDGENITITILKFSPAYLVFVCAVLVVILTLVIKYHTKSENLFRGGMPSAHAAVAFCAATCILFITGNTVVSVLGYFLAVLVAQSRVEGGIHSALQAVLGSFLGVLSTVLVFQVLYRL